MSQGHDSVLLQYFIKKKSQWHKTKSIYSFLMGFEVNCYALAKLTSRIWTRDSRMPVHFKANLYIFSSSEDHELPGTSVLMAVDMMQDG